MCVLNPKPLECYSLHQTSPAFFTLPSALHLYFNSRGLLSTSASLTSHSPIWIRRVTYIICDNIHLYTIYISYPKTLSQAPTKRVGDRHIGEVIHLWMQALSGAHESELKGIAVIIYDYFAYYDDYLNYHRLHRRRLVQEAK